MAWQKIILVTVVFLIGTCKALKARIYNGQDAKIENYPYQASFRFGNNIHLCGGSIISEKHILTACHCIGRNMVPPYLGLTVVTGTNHVHVGGNHHKIAKITIHPKCTARPDGMAALADVAVITLKDPIVFDKYQQKVNLPDKNHAVGTRANVTGWGRAADKRTHNELQRLETTLISREDCQKRIIGIKNVEPKIYDSEICTFQRIGKGTCHGDSGGPLVINGEVVGIVAWGNGENCAGGYPDIFADVYSSRDFIESVMSSTV